VTSQFYSLRGTFNGGMPGDMITGKIELQGPAGGESGTAGAATFTIVIAGRRATLAPCVLDEVGVTPAGAVSFRIAPDGWMPWVFTGFLSGQAISGSHRMERAGKKPLTGSWTAVPAHPHHSEAVARG
jgi:hypothetical protein